VSTVTNHYELIEHHSRWNAQRPADWKVRGEHQDQRLGVLLIPCHRHTEADGSRGGSEQVVVPASCARGDDVDRVLAVV